MDTSTDNPYAAPADEPDVVPANAPIQFNAAGSGALLITIMHCMGIFVAVEWLLGIDDMFSQNTGVFPAWINAARVVVPLVGFYGSLIMTGLCLVYRMPAWMLPAFWVTWTAVYCIWFSRVLSLTGRGDSLPAQAGAAVICLSAIGVSLWIGQLAAANREQSLEDAAWNRTTTDEQHRDRRFDRS